MSSYRKGYVAENQLTHELYSRGWAVMRAPRSGSTSIASPDIVAAKHGRLLAIECKSRDDAFAVRKEQLNELEEWVKRAHATAYIAWKISRKGWFFLRLEDVVKTHGKVNRKSLDHAISMDHI
ncbi:MAG: hypothetical protein HZB67_02120 [Candidatus Aenigmarchaeota archaeon]|nr:hypothetical protein [Candidatus Aenigmarchaeota archaeon]